MKGKDDKLHVFEWVVEWGQCLAKLSAWITHVEKKFCTHRIRKSVGLMDGSDETAEQNLGDSGNGTQMTQYVASPSSVCTVR